MNPYLLLAIASLVVFATAAIVLVEMMLVVSPD